ncbi:MAG: cytochrome c biogenesis protein CcdA [Anaerolineae bacterium]
MIVGGRADALLAGSELPTWATTPLTNAATGATFTLADFAGRTVYVEPLATWCTNCRAQQRDVRTVREQLGEGDYAHVSLSVEPERCSHVGLGGIRRARELPRYLPSRRRTWSARWSISSAHDHQSAVDAAFHHQPDRGDLAAFDRASHRRATGRAVDYRRRSVGGWDSGSRQLSCAAAILTNACVLPLYPGLIAFMAGDRRARGWLGLLVLLGVLSAMLVVGLVVSLAQITRALLQYLLPIIYALVIAFGVLLLLDRSPFARLATVQVPMLCSPYAAAYVYGLLFGPMTLPCAGPIITSAFVLGAGLSCARWRTGCCISCFSLGFGLPLDLLPLVALPVQRRLVGLAGGAQYAAQLRVGNSAGSRWGVFGILTELLPNYFPDLYFTPEMWVLYWLVVAAVIVGVVVISQRAGVGDADGRGAPRQPQVARAPG